MIPTLSQVCSLSSPFETDFEDYAAGKCQSIEIWLTKLEAYLQENSVEDFDRLRSTHEVATPVASYQGGLLSSQGPSREEAWKLFRQRLQLCQQVKIPMIVVACDVWPPIEQIDIERTQMSLRQLSDEAGKHEIRIALELQSKAAFGNNLQTVVALVSEIGNEYLGICLDVFHFYVGPSKISDLQLLTAENLFHVQMSDVADVPREFAADGDRILPGEGDIPTGAILERLQQINYSRCVSIELMNPRMWQVPALQFGEVGMTSLRKLLGQAEN